MARIPQGADAATVEPDAPVADPMSRAAVEERNRGAIPQFQPPDGRTPPRPPPRQATEQEPQGFEIIDIPEGAELQFEAPAKSISGATIDVPDGAELVSEGGAPEIPEEPSIGGRIVQRFLGTDVEDPLEFTRLGTTMLGAVGGSIFGTRTPVGPGPLAPLINPITGGVAGGAAGAFIGAVAPETTLEIGEELGVLDPGTRDRLGLSPEELRTVAEGEILLEIATGGGLSALRMAGRGLSRVLTGTTPEGVMTAERSAESGIHLMPVQVGGRSIARGFVSVMGRFPLIGTTIRRRGQAAEDALRTALTDVGERVGPLRAFSDISETIYSDARNLVRETNRYFGDRYTALFARADDLGVQVVPRETLMRADEILKKLAAQTPRQVTGEGTPGPALQTVKDFIEREVLPMRTGEAGSRVTAKQSFRQMDGLISKIDQQLASLEPSQRRFAQTLMLQLRQAAQGDVIVNARGVNALEIANELKILDTEFSQTMSEIFETATAKQFGSVRRRGLRAIEVDEATRIPIDQLSRMVIKLDSPQAMADLAKLVTPETYQAITARVLDDAVSDSLTVAGELGQRFDPDRFAKRLGLDRPGSNKYIAVSEMLQRAGGDVTMRDLETLDEAARVIAGLDLPNVSSFIARRATIGGIRSVINGVIPGLAVAGTGHATAGVPGAILGIATMVGGGRMISAIISDPKAVRLFRSVARQEAQQVFGKNGLNPSWRRAVLGLMRAGAMSLDDPTDIARTSSQEMMQIAEEAMDALERQIIELMAE